MLTGDVLSVKIKKILNLPDSNLQVRCSNVSNLHRKMLLPRGCCGA